MDPATFWGNVGRPDARGCREWQGARDRDGYGRLAIAGRPWRAHRLAYRLATGSDPGPLMVCHSCDNPACCEPSHLWLGTNRDNQLDCERKGRRKHRPQQGQDNGHAVLTEDQAQQAIDLIAAGRKNIEIATVFGVTHAAVSAIRRGKSWPGLPRPTNDNFKRYASLRRCP